MSRIGKKPITIPEGVDVTIDENNLVVVKGPKGQLQFQFNKLMTIEKKENEIIVTRLNDDRLARSLHGTTRSILQNMITGVTAGFTKELLIHGVGYRAQIQGNKLVLSLGKAHTDDLEIPEGITVELPKNTQIIVKGVDKQRVGEFAAKIRSCRKPEPYKGKGIRYKDERIIIKEGKTAK